MESSIAFIILLGLAVIVLSITTIVLIIRVNKLEDIVMDHDNEIHERFKPDVEYVSWRRPEDMTVKGKADVAYFATKMIEDHLSEFIEKIEDYLGIVLKTTPAQPREIKYVAKKGKKNEIKK